MSASDNKNISSSPNETAQSVVRIVCDITRELNPDALENGGLGLDSNLDHDLGLDSLARAELLIRIEAHFKASLPEHTLTSIETPRDLIKALLQADTSVKPDAIDNAISQVTLDSVESHPTKVKTLQELLSWHVKKHPDRPHLYVFQNADKVDEISYKTLHSKAVEVAAGLIDKGVEPGDRVAIMLPTCNDYFFSFFGILFARAIPIPIYPPARMQQIEDHLKRHASILKNAQAKLLITVKEAKPLSQLLKLQVSSVESVVTFDELEGSRQPVDVGEAKEKDIAFLQYTSGSTGVPKGVTLTHANLLANVRAMGKVIHASSDDVFVSWLPVYHDMGLIGAWFGSLYHSIPLVIMSPLLFLTKPQRWLWAIHHYRGTLSPAPNFAYELCVNRISDAELEGLDLSSWRLSWNGAEPVSPQTIQSFTGKFAKFGYKPETMSPVYGLAESSVGLTFPAEIRTPRIEYFCRDELSLSGRAVQADSSDENSIAMVGLGQPLPEHQIRIVDDLGKELPDGEEGALEFKGPSSTQGYYRRPDKTKELYHDDWLVTGDRAFTLAGELFLTGRSKDIIIRAGRNIYPHELELAVASIPGIRKGCVAAFGSHDSGAGTEKLVVLAESRETDTDQLKRFKKQINSLAIDLLGSPVDDVVIGPPHTVPKTSSGKIRRSACKEMYEKGTLGERQKAVWLQALQLAIAGVVPQIRRGSRTAADIGYAAYCWLIMGLLAPLVWILVAILPSQPTRWKVVKYGSRALIRLTGTRLTVKGKSHLPDLDHPSILIANHSSYLDGIIVAAATGLPCRFVAKAELLKQPVARIFLTRLGTEFVERFDAEKSIVDADKIINQANNNQALLIFPEGTLYRMAGLHEFHMGAFMAAAHSGLPVTPLTICGSRAKLRGNSLFPRRGAVNVTISQPLLPEGADWESAVVLRDKARNEILNHCEEPDMAHNSTR
ncbi:AMP-binding protein [Vibrio sp. JC009]|uniref:AMP-binding protein n=1 Tax=Vibrio sp. JC009 TaxID=2912314 RepID=UPI0023B1F67C|nr:AMP-binding protein [Vibrio sp. JC009]WED23036.1 AMP-binding protein [Vibrio sp. JC009]